jgi:hypothetical protein
VHPIRIAKPIERRFHTLSVARSQLGQDVHARILVPGPSQPGRFRRWCGLSGRRRREIDNRPPGFRRHDNGRHVGIGVLHQLLHDDVEVEAIEPAADPPRGPREDDDDGDQLGAEEREARQQQQLHDDRAHRVAGTIAGYVEKRFHLPPFGDVHRHEQQLVAAAEQRSAKHGLDAADHDQHRPYREQQPDSAGERDTGRQRRDRLTDPELLDGDARPGLRDERHDLDHRVEDREEAQQVRTGAHGLRDVPLQQEVQHAGAGRRQQYHQRDGPEMRRGLERLERKHALRRSGIGGGQQHRSTTQHQGPGCAQDVKRRQHQQHRVGRHAHRQPVRRKATQGTPERPRRRDATKTLARAARVEPLADDRPIAGEQQRSQTRDVQVDRHSDPRPSAG